jgi:hypothetical protein
MLINKQFCFLPALLPVRTAWFNHQILPESPFFSKMHRDVRPYGSNRRLAKGTLKDKNLSTWGSTPS